MRQGFLVLSLNTLALLKSHFIVYLVYLVFESLSSLDLFFSKALIKQSITVFLLTVNPEKDVIGSKVSFNFWLRLSLIFVLYKNYSGERRLDLETSKTNSSMTSILFM